ncbi:tetratricopeptide repeat protein [Kangiella shandongensis]|uniref:tetratricopeptide repeat protein n=1 Tax=Kangiella shandongensis TaxID=2763258 RepID=UPI001CBFAFFC|nr:tetratricopeptide repeat protein [Kangiella shandongensis]
MISSKYNKGLSAPALCLIALLLTIVLVIVERNEREVINEGTLIQIDVDDSPSESVDSGSDNDEFDIPAPQVDDNSDNKSITEELIKETTLVLSKTDVYKKVLWRIHRIEPLKGFSEKDKNKVLFKAALKLFAKGDYERTHKILGKLPRSTRHKERPGFYYALALTKDDEIDKAIKAYQGQLERFPHHQASAINYGLLLLDDKQYEKAVKAFKYAISTTSGRRKSKSYRNLGTAYYELGQYEDAVKSFKKAIEYQPNNSTTWLKLAEAQQELPKFSQKEVLETYQKSISLAPNRYKSALKRGNYLFSELMFADAAKDYAEARKRSSDLVETALMQSINYLAAGDLEAADKSLNSIRQSNDDEELLIELLKALSNEKYDAAESVIDEINDEKNFKHDELFKYLKLKLAVIQEDKSIIKSFDKDLFEHPLVGWPSQLEYTRALYQQEQYKEAQTFATKIADNQPNSAEAHLINGQVELKNEQITTGFQSLKHAYNIYPESRRIAFIYAQSLFEFERYKQALAVVNILIEQHQKFIAAYELKARVHQELAQYDLAREAYTQAFELDDKNLHSAYELAKLESELGNDRQSLLILDDLLERDSSYIDARQLRAILLCDARKYAECVNEAKNIVKLDEDNQGAKALIKEYESLVENTEESSGEGKGKEQDKNETEDTADSESKDKNDKDSAPKDKPEDDSKNPAQDDSKKGG